jgi:hypothetical protein
MRSAIATYLVDKTHLKQKALTLRIPQHVHDALNVTRERANSAGFMFDIQAVVVEALERAVTKVVNELEALEQGTHEAGKPESKAPARRQRKPVKAVDEVKQAI